MKGKEALAHQKVVILNLQKRVHDLDTDLKASIQAEREVRLENTQLKTFRDRMKIVAAVTAENEALKRQIETLTDLVTLWTYRATILAQADRDSSETMLSRESIAVLADMDMLPRGITHNRVAKRAAKNSAAIDKHLDGINTTIKELAAKGVPTQLEVW